MSYYKILNFDRSNYKYGQDILNDKLLSLLGNSFLDAHGLSKYVKNGDLVAEVIVAEHRIKKGLLKEIDEDILFANEIRLVHISPWNQVKPESSFQQSLILEQPTNKFYAPESEPNSKVRNTMADPELKEYVPPLVTENLDQVFVQLISSMNMMFHMFGEAKGAHHLIVKMNINDFSNAKLLKLQEKFQKAMNQNQVDADMFSFEYFHATDKLDSYNNIIDNYMHHVMKEFIKTNPKKYIGFVLSSFGEFVLSYDTDYAMYINTMTDFANFFVGFVFEHPIKIPESWQILHAC